MSDFIMGVDIGGTKIETTLYKFNGDRSFELITSKRMPTQRELGYESVLERLADHIVSTLKDVNVSLDQLKGIGFGLPGTVHPESLKMLNGNSEIFIQKPFADDLRKYLKEEIPIRLANDANLFALAEVHHGAGKKFESETQRSPKEQVAIGIILGTGNGGGLILDGKIYEGRHGGGAEVGHHVLYQNGRPCYCGRNGCAEQYLCGPSIEKNYQEQTGKNLKASEIFKLSDPISLKIQDQYKRDLSEFLANLATLFDPDYFVLGGGISTIDTIYENLEDTLAQKVFLKGTRPRVYRHLVGDSAGVLGAAMLFS